MRRFAELAPMLGREPPKDPMEVAHDRILRDLNTAAGANLGRAVSEAREYLQHHPHDDTMVKALARAQKRLEESNTAG